MMSARFQNSITVLRHVPTYQALIGVSVVKAIHCAGTEKDAKVKYYVNPF